MPKFRTIRETRLLENVLAGAPVLRLLPIETEFNGEQSDVLRFVHTTELGPQPGFVLMRDLEALPDVIVPLSMNSTHYVSFASIVTEAARHIGWLRGTGADRDYLLAVAYHASSNLTDMGTAQEAGPFRYTEALWNAAITQYPDLGLQPEDRLDWRQQPELAANLAADAARSFEQTTGKPPTFAQLLFFQREGRIPTNADRTDVDSLQQGLVTAYAEALQVIDQLPPDLRLVRPEAGAAPWLNVAREELSRGVVEVPGVLDNDRIRRYHLEAGIGAAHDDTPWCGSFVTFCMKKCGDDTIAQSLPPRPALAASWSVWGRDVTAEKPVGCVAVFTFQDGRHHVGFLVGLPNANHVTVLGGNQGSPGKISEVSFPLSQATAFRWLDLPNMEPVGIETSAIARAGDALFLQKAPGIMYALMSDLPGLTLIQAAAILGNIGHECGAFTTLHQIGMANGQGGHGWCQWDGSRRRTFLAFASSLDLDWSQDEANYRFLIQELRGSEGNALTSLLQQTTLEAAVEDFDAKFERSGVKHMDRRIRYARLALAAVGD
jgi:uncharacterized protein (TIGR02594 family)